MNILVVVGTGSGCTLETGQEIVRMLEEENVQAVLSDARDNPDPAAFDAIIAGSGVRAGNWHGSIRKWMTRHAAELGRKPLATFTVCLTILETGKDEEVQAYSDNFLKTVFLAPLASGLFPGWFVPERFGFFERLILKMFKAKKGDFRDPGKVRDWTRNTLQLFRTFDGKNPPPSP